MIHAIEAARPRRPNVRALSGAMLAVLLLTACGQRNAQSAPPDDDRLAALPVARDSVTVSGISAGGYMAVQFHVAHSALVHGAGVIAAGPYYCAENSMRHALGRCMKGDSDIPVDELISATSQLALDETIDPIAGLADDRVWIFHGSEDPFVGKPVVDALQAYYTALVDPEHIVAIEGRASAHVFPARDDPVPRPAIGPRRRSSALRLRRRPRACSSICTAPFPATAPAAPDWRAARIRPAPVRQGREFVGPGRNGLALRSRGVQGRRQSAALSAARRVSWLQARCFVRGGRLCATVRLSRSRRCRQYRRAVSAGCAELPAAQPERMLGLVGVRRAVVRHPGRPADRSPCGAWSATCWVRTRRRAARPTTKSGYQAVARGRCVPYSTSSRRTPLMRREVRRTSRMSCSNSVHAFLWAARAIFLAESEVQHRDVLEVGTHVDRETDRPLASTDRSQRVTATSGSDATRTRRPSPSS